VKSSIEAERQKRLAAKSAATADQQRNQAVAARQEARDSEAKARKEQARAEELAKRLEAMFKIVEERSQQQTLNARPITLSNLAAIMLRSSEQNRAVFLQPLNRAMVEFSISTRLRQAHFLAQIGHESADLRYTEELASGDRYEGRSALGNTQPGDGRLFKGRGLFFLTGRANYATYGTALGLDLVGNPELAAQPDVAARLAAIFWKLVGLNELADCDDLRAITRRISGGLRGLNDLSDRVARAKLALDVGNVALCPK
jgi:predicted chitinase